VALSGHFAFPDFLPQGYFDLVVVSHLIEKLVTVNGKLVNDRLDDGLSLHVQEDSRAYFLVQ
jgi:hypothetical protein